MSRLVGGGQGQSAGFTPPVDIYETDNAIAIRVEIPGVKAEDVQISVENNVLTIRGERRFDHEESKEGYHRIERSYGSFSRSFVLPSSVDGEQIDAAMDNGMLTLTLPKKAVAKPRAINVRSSSQMEAGGAQMGGAQMGGAQMGGAQQQAGEQAGSQAQGQGASQQQGAAGDGGRRAQHSSTAHPAR